MAELGNYKLQKGSDFQLGRVKVVTGKGIAIWPRLNEPDTKFKAEGQYTVRLKLNAEDSAKLITQIDEMAAIQLALEIERLQEIAAGDDKEKAKKAKAALKEGATETSAKFASKAYKPVLDDDCDETGEFEFNFKMAAQRTDRKTKKVTRQSPNLIDSRGNALDRDDVQIWGGSTLKIGGYLKPFAKPIGVGVALGLGTVQVIKLVTSGDGGFDMGVEEDGYEGSSKKSSKSTDDTAAPAGGDSDGDAEGDEF